MTKEVVAPIHRSVRIRNLPRPVGTPPVAGSLAGKVAATSCVREEK